jgi:tetratricopeptide (TPR) repeat protein
VQERFDEAEETAETARESALPGEVHQQVVWRTVAARLASRKGDEAAAERLAREAVLLTADTDALNLRADALVALADVLRAREREDEAVAAVAEAVELYRRKGNVAALATIGDAGIRA